MTFDRESAIMDPLNLLYNFTIWNMQNLSVSVLLSLLEYIQRSEWIQSLLLKNWLQNKIPSLIARMIYSHNSIRSKWYSVPQQLPEHIQRFYRNLNRVQNWRNLSYNLVSENDKKWYLALLKLYRDLFAQTSDSQTAGLQIHTTNSGDTVGQPTTLPVKLARYSKSKPQKVKTNG